MGNLNKINTYAFINNPCNKNISNDIFPHKVKNADDLFFDIIFNKIIINAIANIAKELAIKYCNNSLGNHGVEITTKKLKNVKLTISFLLI